MSSEKLVIQVYGPQGINDVKEYECEGGALSEAVRSALWETGVWPQPITDEPNFEGWSRVVINIGPAPDEEE